MRNSTLEMKRKKASQLWLGFHLSQIIIMARFGGGAPYRLLLLGWLNLFGLLSAFPCSEIRWIGAWRQDRVWYKITPLNFHTLILFDILSIALSYRTFFFIKEFREPNFRRQIKLSIWKVFSSFKLTLTLVVSCSTGLSRTLFPKASTCRRKVTLDRQHLLPPCVTLPIVLRSIGHKSTLEQRDKP